MSALLLHARRHQWQFFAGFSFANEQSMAESVRGPMQFEFMRRCCAKWHFPIKKFEFLIREELGEKTERLHWHALFSGLPPSLVNRSSCFVMIKTWENMGGGHSRVRVFDERLPGSDYVLKGLEGSQAANAYELSKFNESGTLKLIPAHRLIRQWVKWFEPDRRLRKARDMRTTSRRDLKTGRNGAAYALPDFGVHPADQIRLYVH